MNSHALHWNSQQDNYLLQSRREHIKWKVISEEVGRSIAVCSYRYKVLQNGGDPVRSLKVEAVEENKKQLPTRMCIRCRKVEVLGWSYCEKCRSVIGFLDSPFLI